MNKQTNEAVEKLDVESLIVDLLACGLGACIILFFIFSIKIIGKNNNQTVVSSTQRTTGRGSGYVSLIGDDGDKKKRMGSIRIIEFSKLSDDNFNAIKNYALSKKNNFWDEFKHFKKQDKFDSLYNSIRTQVQVRKNNISFIIYADGMREIDFSFPDDLKNIIQNTRAQNAVLKIFALEGRSVKGNFNGDYEWGPYPLTNLRDFKLTFKIGRTSNIEKLLTVQKN